MPQDLRRTLFTWKWFIVLGLALIALGAIGLGSTVLLRVALPLVLGPILMVSGILQVLLGFFTQPWKGSVLHLMAAALDMVVGLLVLTHPGQAAADLALLLVAYLLVGGLYRIFGSLLLGLPAGWSALAAGAVPVVLGLLLWTHRPFQELWLFGLCVAIDFICHGGSWIVFSGAVRPSPGAAPEPAAPPAPSLPESSPPTEETGQDVRQLLDQFQALLDRDGQALERVDELIRKARKKREEVYGVEAPKD
jgi:uncharacterized membrane protein HdeD (DUF308 family)